MVDEFNDLKGSISAFEAALSGEHVTLPDTALDGMLLALDGSNQDPTAEALARTLAVRHGATVWVLPEGDADAEAAVQRLSEAGAEAEPLARGEGNEPFERILQRANERKVNLIVVCSPFLGDLTVYGQESIGETLDMLMSRARRPLLVIRDPVDDVEPAFDSTLIPITFDSKDNPRAAAWALRLTSDSGSITLMAVADTSVLESAAHLLGEYVEAGALDADTLERLESREHGALIAALQKAASDRQLGCRVNIRAGHAVQIITDVANDGTNLVITSCPSDRQNKDYQLVQSFLRESRNPVLIV